MGQNTITNKAINRLLYLFIKVSNVNCDESTFLNLASSRLIIKPIDPNFIVALIILEDKRFFDHNGYDLLAICRSFFRNSLGLGFSGASTITQQLVRLMTKERDISFKRKIKEIYLAQILELRFNKLEILNLYLDLNYYGDFEFCSKNKYQILSNISIESISLKTSFLVASLIKYPAPFKKSKSWERKIFKRYRKGMKVCNNYDYIQRIHKVIRVRC